MYILALDQGTTSSRAFVYSDAGEALAVAQQEFTQFYPADGWVEHDPEEIWRSMLEVIGQVVRESGVALAEIAAIGITNQRETTLVWDRKTGEPIHKAIVWQDRRTAETCRQLQEKGFEEEVTRRTGLLLDPYFSATKVGWLLDHVDGARERAERGELAFGTVDCFLLWRLTGGRVHKTDATNASRTMLFNIHDQVWDVEICSRLGVPLAMLPEVEDCSFRYGDTDPDVLGAAIPVTGIAGDQQAALVGQSCFEPGMTKSTYGTGCFVIMNTGTEAVRSENRLLTTVGYRLGGQVTYGLEGSIFIAGAAVQWLRDGLRFFERAEESEALAKVAGTSAGVHVVPAFTGLGAPYWDPDARGALLGLTRDTGVGEIVAATLEAVCYQTRDLLEAMARDGQKPTELRVDGGMVSNEWFTQCLADTLALPVVRPGNFETTALGACYLAGLGAGIFDSMAAVSGLDQGTRRFESRVGSEERETRYAGWQDAVSRVRSG